MDENLAFLLEICGNCGLTYGAHSTNHFYSTFYKKEIPTNSCPGHQGRMDWDSSCETVFLPTNIYKDVPFGTPHKLLGGTNALSSNKLPQQEIINEGSPVWEESKNLPNPALKGAGKTKPGKSLSRK